VPVKLLDNNSLNNQRIMVRVHGRNLASVQVSTITCISRREADKLHISLAAGWYLATAGTMALVTLPPCTQHQLQLGMLTVASVHACQPCKSMQAGEHGLTSRLRAGTSCAGTCLTGCYNLKVACNLEEASRTSRECSIVSLPQQVEPAVCTYKHICTHVGGLQV
jgi:hypothetical protein